jgi:hypothetical protein
MRDVRLRSTYGGSSDSWFRPSCSSVRGTAENSANGFDEARCALSGVVTEQVGSMDRSECAAGADVTIRDIALIESNRDEPRVIRTAQSRLLDG